MVLLLLLTGSCTSSTMNYYVPARCHGVAEPFETYTVTYEDVPEFILEVIDTSLAGAMARQGMRPAEEPGDAQVLLHVELDIIDRNPPRDTAVAPPRDPFAEPPMGEPRRDPFGETVAPSELNRFVTHLMLHVIDQRTGSLIWTGAVDRAHAIQGGETFHDERAVLLISNTFDEMFVGLTTPCE